MGKTYCSCGHSDEAGSEIVEWKEVECDAIDGFYNVAAYGELCSACAASYREAGELLETEEARQAWFDAGRRKPKS